MKLALLILCLCMFNVATGIIYGRAWACQGHSITIRCPAKTNLYFLSAFYGRRSLTFCNPARFNVRSIPTTTCSAAGVLTKLIARCSGKPTCLLQASNGVFGDPCVGTFKYLIVYYICL
nr:hypothetical protein [Crepidula fornicata]